MVFVIAAELLETLSQFHSDIRKYRRDLSSDYRLKAVQTKGFSALKEKILMIEAQGGSPTDQSQADERSAFSTGFAKATKAVFGSGGAPFPRLMSDTDFLRELPVIVERFPELAAEAQEARSIVRQHFVSKISEAANRIARKIEELQRNECRSQLQNRRKYSVTAARDDSRKAFIETCQHTFVRDPNRYAASKGSGIILSNAICSVFIIEDIRSVYSAWSRIGLCYFILGGIASSNYHAESFRLTGVEQWTNAASLKHTISLFQVTETDKHAMQLDKAHVPNPRLANSSYPFSITLHHRILCVIRESASS